MAPVLQQTHESLRLEQAAARVQDWKRWGPYLAERQWGTVREDYSAQGSAWDYFPHEHARSRAYRWGEDGLLGISDGRGVSALRWRCERGDAILRRRLFGYRGPEGITAKTSRSATSISTRRRPSRT